MRILTVLIMLVGSVVSAAASQKVAVFPFEIDYPQTEDDFFIGEKKMNEAEATRLKLVHAEFQKLLTADGRYVAVDLDPLADEITSKQPLYNCNDCDVDIAKKAGADIAVTVVMDKISETHLNMIITLRDAATGGVLRNVQAVVQGNTDETWLHGARWLIKNRLLAEGKSQ